MLGTVWPSGLSRWLHQVLVSSWSRTTERLYLHRITPAVIPSYSQPCWSEDVAHVHDHSLLPVLLRGICWRETFSLRGSVVPAFFTSSGIRDA